MRVERRRVIIQLLFIQENCCKTEGTKMSGAKPFTIERQLVMDAYLKVKANKGVAGVDEMSLQKFDDDLKNHLYKIWNKMSSGSYMPPPVMLVEIPKKGGGKRPLGIPTVADRIAQAVVAGLLEKGSRTNLP